VRASASPDGAAGGTVPDEVGTKTFEREHELSLANNSRDLLAQVDRALPRLHNGTHGDCENCANPWVRLGSGRSHVPPCV
jgi:DnaK suppressor protein